MVFFPIPGSCMLLIAKKGGLLQCHNKTNKETNLSQKSITVITFDCSKGQPPGHFV